MGHIFSPEELIKAYGKQAYHKAVRMTVEAFRAGDLESARELARTSEVLMLQGYYKVRKEREA